MNEQRKAPQHMPLETILVTAVFTIETPEGYDQSKEVTYRIKQVENL